MAKTLLILLACLLSCLALSQSSTKIKAGDKIRLTCEEEATLNKEYTVTQQGIILVDFLGAVKVEGLTESDAATTISNKLVNERILRSATVTVKIVESSMDPIVFRGAVSVTGQATFRDGIRLSDIIRVAQADETTDLSRIEIRSRDGKLAVVNFLQFDPSTNENNPLLKPGDTVLFSAKGRPGLIIVLGGVENPGGVEMTQGMTVRSAIVAAGGFSAIAVRTNVRLERTGVAPVKINLLVGGKDVEVRVGDRIIVAIKEQREYVQVFGSVEKQGFMDFFSGLTLSQAVDASGGTRAEAKRGSVRLTRNEGEKHVTFHDLDDIAAGLEKDPVLQPNDKIYVDRTRSKSMDLIKSLAMLALLYILIGR